MTPFDPTSRYYHLPTTTYTDASGRTVTYLTRRFLSQGERQTTLVEVPVTSGDRLDLLAYRTLGDPLQFWRIADANNALHPWDLMQELGRAIRVTMPQIKLGG